MGASPKRLKPATHYSAVVGQVLAWLREQQGWAQGTMAGRMGISHAAWSRIERGEAVLSPARLRVASRVLGETPDEVFRLADEVAEGARARGVTVVDDRPVDWVVAGAIFVGVAALAALIGRLLEE